MRTETRVIRRVQAVVHVKREESDEEHIVASELWDDRRPENTRAKPGTVNPQRKRGSGHNPVSSGSGYDSSEDGEDSDDELMLTAEVCKTFQIPNPG